MDENFKFNLFKTSGVDNMDSGLHFHDCLEINYILSGSGVNMIEQQSYAITSGDIYVINNLEHHMAVCEKSLEMLVIVFDADLVWQTNPTNYDYLKPFFNRSLRFSNRITKSDMYYLDLESTILKLEKEWELRAEGYELAIRALLMYLLALLYRQYALKDELGEDIKKFHSAYDKIRPSVEYIHKHFTEDISLEHLAHLAYMNKSYFSTYFKSVMNKTVTSYIENLRLQQACLLMATSQRTLSEIAMASGFNSISYFNRAFNRHYGVPPNIYRKNPKFVQ